MLRSVGWDLGGGPEPQLFKLGDPIAAALSTIFQIDSLHYNRNRLLGLETVRGLLGGPLNLSSRFLGLSVSSLKGEGGTREKILLTDVSLYLPCFQGRQPLIVGFAAVLFYFVLFCWRGGSCWKQKPRSRPC